MNKLVTVTLKGKQGTFSIALVPGPRDSWDLLAWRALAELQKQGKPVTKHDTVSFTKETENE